MTSHKADDLAECELSGDFHAEWAEPGKTVLFSRAVNGLTNIWKYSLQDRSLTQITFGTGPDVSPMTDPGGKGIYYVNGKSSAFLTAYHFNTRESMDIVSEDATQPAISLDGKRVMYLRLPAPQRTELWVADIDGRSKVRIATGDESLSTGSWAPDNFHLSFAGGAGGSKVYIVGADGSGLRQLPQMGDSVGSSVWSPDQKFVYVSAVGKESSIPTVWKSSVDGSSPDKFIYNCGSVADVDPSGHYLLSLVGGEKMGIYEVPLPIGNAPPCFPGFSPRLQFLLTTASRSSMQSPRAVKPRFTVNSGQMENSSGRRRLR